MNPFEIKKVKYADLPQAAAIHSVSWQASHQAICSEAFLSIHTPEHQKKYLEQAMENGAGFYMLSVKGKPVGIVSVHKSLIENLYVLPEEQNRGYGTRLLRHAIEKCDQAPTLWILEKNEGARRLYERTGFRMTGRMHTLSDTIAECEMRLG
ncbi:MAG: GNAT family N-acetyltransferase [Eubacteriales bacterium]|nr:GNAT family N-acetyltransferase [Eubacteriales bacterium]